MFILPCRRSDQRSSSHEDSTLKYQTAVVLLLNRNRGEKVLQATNKLWRQILETKTRVLIQTRPRNECEHDAMLVFRCYTRSSLALIPHKDPKKRTIKEPLKRILRTKKSLLQSSWKRLTSYPPIRVALIQRPATKATRTHTFSRTYVVYRQKKAKRLFPLPLHQVALVRESRRNGKETK